MQTSDNSELSPNSKVLVVSKKDLISAQMFADQYGFDFEEESSKNLQTGTTQYAFELHWDEGFLIFEKSKKLSIDFDHDKINYWRIPSGKNELLAKALGLSKGIKSVVDLTTGLGSDAVFMARLGIEVTTLERNPILYFILQKGLQKSQSSIVPFLNKITWLHEDSATWLEKQPDRQIECLYFDPMYPHKKKSALPRQEMIVFRELVGEDLDSAHVLQIALKKARRVVVKRPLKSEPLHLPVKHSFEGKVVRYDLYINE
jgi:16S rRNA (guanine1516-N2)-methyltransferase